ncbi:hypothetical protein SNL152K_719 [Streptomyces sp. NL15-2K]|nr:hypothetical protein SNL152K_719 [Streptomyces sp. NL15-2K]
MQPSAPADAHRCAAFRLRGSGGPPRTGEGWPRIRASERGGTDTVLPPRRQPVTPCVRVMIAVFIELSSSTER